MAGYFGRWIDEVLMRITDTFLAFPPLLLAVLVAAALGANLRKHHHRHRRVVVALVRAPGALAGAQPA